jgi:hypothetical protein
MLLSWLHKRCLNLHSKTVYLSSTQARAQKQCAIRVLGLGSTFGMMWWWLPRRCLSLCNKAAPSWVPQEMFEQEQRQHGLRVVCLTSGMSGGGSPCDKDHFKVC